MPATSPTCSCPSRPPLASQASRCPSHHATRSCCSSSNILPTYYSCAEKSRGKTDHRSALRRLMKNSCTTSQARPRKPQLRGHSIVYSICTAYAGGCWCYAIHLQTQLLLLAPFTVLISVLPMPYIQGLIAAPGTPGVVKAERNDDKPGACVCN